jgi:hypothetical protein
MKPTASKLPATIVAVSMSLLASGVAGAAVTNVAVTEIVLVDAAAVSQQAIVSWKKEGFHGVAIVLEEDADRPMLEVAATQAAAADLGLYFWIEVGRNAKLAHAHPRWMASLGMHEDWQKRFPGSRLPNQDEVAKAWPWVPIWYREAFEAHLQRIELLLAQTPKNYRGLLLNDLQGAPASCGCGNLQCRWATDYHVAATGQRIPGDDAPAQFLSAVRNLVSKQEKPVIPVWTTECADEDLPANHRKGKPSTGLCGGVGCSVGLCPKEFGKQWSALLRGTDAPVAVLGLHRQLDRAGNLYGGGPAWLTNAVDYLDSVPRANGGMSLQRDRLWIVVQGQDTNEESSARRIARRLGVSAIVVARTRIDQSYEPRLIPAR